MCTPFYDFGKTLREVIENFGSVCQEVIAKILETIRCLFMLLITIDVVVGASLFAVNQKNDSKNTSKYIINFAKDLFT